MTAAPQEADADAAGVIIQRGDRYFAIACYERSGLISWPGGTVERGEHPMQAAWRECWEELGASPADVFVGRLVSVARNTSTDCVFALYEGICLVPLHELLGSDEGSVLLATEDMLTGVASAFPGSQRRALAEYKKMTHRREGWR